MHQHLSYAWTQAGTSQAWDSLSLVTAWTGKQAVGKALAEVLPRGLPAG